MIILTDESLPTWHVAKICGTLSDAAGVLLQAAAAAKLLKPPASVRAPVDVRHCMNCKLWGVTDSAMIRNIWLNNCMLRPFLSGGKVSLCCTAAAAADAHS
jgi:hypothetical protein